MTCLSLVDNFRCLVGDSNGQLHMLFLETEENMEADTPRVAALDLDTDKRQTSSSVTSLRLELLGEVRGEREWGEVCGSGGRGWKIREGRVEK